MQVGSVISFDKISKPESLLSNKNISQSEKVDFSEILNSAINKVNDMQIDSDKLTNDFAAGKTDNIHDVMITAEKASIALQLTMQVRTKILDAYNEIMRIQL